MKFVYSWEIFTRQGGFNMKIVGNGRMITRDASNTFYENGAVAMDGSTIVMAGETEEVKKAYPDAEFIDAKGGVIMPAFINAHEHIYSSPLPED